MMIMMIERDDEDRDEVRGVKRRKTGIIVKWKRHLKILLKFSVSSGTQLSHEASIRKTELLFYTNEIRGRRDEFLTKVNESFV